MHKTSFNSFNIAKFSENNSTQNFYKTFSNKKKQKLENFKT